ncbi:hypothetical protein EDC01DRAFT_780229 [Geopyxis carbonaria]|nr:hypothetical protein EDC01DRAFT_780229 [Geopyxis carbonaria]
MSTLSTPLSYKSHQTASSTSKLIESFTMVTTTTTVFTTLAKGAIPTNGSVIRYLVPSPDKNYKPPKSEGTQGLSVPWILILVAVWTAAAVWCNAMGIAGWVMGIVYGRRRNPQ